MAGSTTLRIVVLAATKMANAICVAGVDPRREWVRPVPSGGNNFEPSKLSQAGRVIVEAYNEVDFVARGPRKVPPQTEDMEIDVRTGPRLVRTLSERELAKLLNEVDESTIVSNAGSEASLIRELVSLGRSLLVTKVDEVLRAYRRVYGGKSQRRIVFRVGKATLDLSCTDLRWRAITRGDRDDTALSQMKLASEVFLALGLTRPFDHDYYCMVIGVHPIPLLNVTVNYESL